MAKVMVKLTFPQELIKEPVTFTMAKKYEIMPNIRRAKVSETVGEVIMELEGEKENLEQGIKYLEDNKVKVEPVVGDIIE